MYDRYDACIMHNEKIIIDSDNEYHESYTYILGNAAYDMGLLSSEYDTLTDTSYTHNGKGLSIRLTIDDQLQKMCYELVKDHRKSIVILSKDGGEVLALADSYEEPFNLSGKVTAEQLESYSSAHSPVWLPEHMHSYHVGSIMKAFTAAVACDVGLSDFSVLDTGTAFFSGKAICNSYDTTPKTETMTSAFVNSSNVYFSNLAVAIGADTLKEYIDRFCMNTEVKTDFGTIVNSSGLKKRRTQNYDIAAFGYGQGDGTYNTVAMAMITQAALTGRLYRPHIIESAFYYDEDGEEVTVRQTKEEILSDNIISPEACAQVEALMKAAARESGFPEGSGVKTGTAEIWIDGQANRATMIGVYDKFIIAISEISGTGEELYGSSHTDTMKHIMAVLEQY